MIAFVDPSALSLVLATQEAKQFGHRTGANDDLVRGEWIRCRAFDLDRERMARERYDPMPDESL